MLICGRIVLRKRKVCPSNAQTTVTMCWKYALDIIFKIHPYLGQKPPRVGIEFSKKDGSNDVDRIRVESKPWGSLRFGIHTIQPIPVYVPFICFYISCTK